MTFYFGQITSIHGGTVGVIPPVPTPVTALETTRDQKFHDKPVN